MYGLPVEVEDLYAKDGDIDLFDVLFTEDFGEYKKGNKCDHLTLDVYLMTLTQFDKSGNVVKQTKLRFFPFTS
jgi:hypothetical protein